MRSPFLPQPASFPDLPSVAPRARLLRQLLFIAFVLAGAAAGWLSARVAARDPADAALQQFTLLAG